MPINIDRYEEYAGEILKVYEEAERTMMRRVSRRLNRGITQPGWTERKYGEMKQVSQEMSRYVNSLSQTRGEMQKAYLEQAYADARAAMISDARTFADLSGIQGMTANTVKVLNIMSELQSSMDAADRHILRKVNDEYAGIVGRASALVATGSITYREAVQRELNDFANRGITSFVDRAGRTWDMETYAEMATLTAIERATREGYLDTMTEFGYDLAEISDHYGACPICEAWQGVIVSVSGTTSGYPSLAEAEDAGVFHSRCMHDISVYYEGISPAGRKEPRDVGEPNAGYAARSQQRYLERMERQWKRRMAVASTPEEERAAYAHVRMYQQRLRDLVGEYNATTDSSVDYLPRKYWREGGRVKLSDAAKKLKPVQILPPTEKPKPEPSKPLTGVEKIKDIIGKHRGTWSVSDLQKVGSMVADEMESRSASYLESLAKIRDELKAQQDKLIDRADELRKLVQQAMRDGDEKLLRKLKRESKSIAGQIDELRERRWNFRKDELGGLLREIIGEIRPVGGIDANNVDDYANFHAYPRNVKKVRATTIEAMNYYPASWLDASKNFSRTLEPAWTTGRAYYSWGEIRFDGTLSTGVHELAHRFEHVFSGIRDTEKEFYERRTRGEELKWLGRGYRRDEKTRRDNFLHPYMGKDYGGYAYELLSMGVQYAYTNHDRLKKDPDMQRWVYGVLAAM